MNESKQAAILIGIIAIIGFAGLYLTGGIPFLEAPFQAGLNLGDVYVDSYRADLYLNGTLMERFDYRIEAPGKYRMLYRKWVMPLSAGGLSVPYVEPLVVIPTSGAIPYIKDNNGIVRILSAGDTRFEGSVQSLAELNEVGGYYPNRFPAGEYQMKYLFQIHPFLECDKELCHWNLMLASEHLPYRELSIYIHDPGDQVDSFFTRPEMESYKEGDTWVITGKSPLDEMIEVEMLLAPEVQNNIEGFPRQVSDIRETTLSAQEGGSGLLFLLRALVAALPLLLAIFYLFFGRERSYTVPRVLSTVPKKRKPWQVNMLFKGDACDFDQDGFYATLLDLHKRNIIRIDNLSGTEIVPLTSSAPDLDDYEREVLDFIRDNSRGGAFSAPRFEAEVKALARSDSQLTLQQLRERMDGILHYANDDVVRSHVAPRGIKAMGLRINSKQLISPLIWVAVFVFFFISGSDILSNPIVMTVLILLLQSTVAAFAPSTLFGRWKDDFYKEKLEWDAFRAFLGDYAMIQKYSPEDLDMWKEWLIYGTALGVGEKVEKALNDLNIPIPEAVAIHTIHTSFSHAYSSSVPRSSSSGGFGGGSGGGFGSGGGGGGGGGGAR